MTAPAPSYEQQLKAQYAIVFSKTRAAPTRAMKREEIVRLPKREEPRPLRPMWQTADIQFDAHVFSYNERYTPKGHIRRRALEFGLSRKEFRTSKNRDVAFMRQQVMVELRDEFDLSASAIGRIMGMDHATVLYAFEKMDYMATEEGRRELEERHRQMDLAKSEVEKGCSFASIGRMLGLTGGTISNWAKRHGWQPIAKDEL
jgi:predicted transcriptional regulator